MAEGEKMRNGAGCSDAACGSSPESRKNFSAKNTIDDSVIKSVCALAQLELSQEECVRVRKDLEEMLDFTAQLGIPDLEETEPLYSVYPAENVFREDEVTNPDRSSEYLCCAPSQRDGMYRVPGTLVQEL